MLRSISWLQFSIFLLVVLLVYYGCWAWRFVFGPRCVESGFNGRRKGCLEKGVRRDSDTKGCGAFYDPGKTEGGVWGVCGKGTGRNGEMKLAG